ncbi:MAG: sulfotransferase [Pseudomonadota bacterium]
MSVQQDLAKAKSLMKKGKTSQAREHFQKILARFPHNRSAIEGLKALAGAPAGPADQKRIAELSRIVALFRGGDVTGAYARLEHVEGQLDPHPETFNLKGVLLSRLQRSNEAIAAYTECLALNPDQLEVLVNLGKSLLNVNRLDEGIAAYQRALKLAPHNYAVALRLATALNSAGDKDDAIKVLDTAMKQHPDNPRLLIERANIDALTLGDPRLDVLAGYLASDEVEAHDKRTIHFVLGRAHDKAGDYARAYDHFQQGNAIRRAEFDYTTDDDRTLFEDIKSAFAAPWAPAPAPDAGPHPIFIVGMPRSGTTLLEQIIGAHRAAQGAGELRFFTQYVRPVFREHGASARDLFTPERLAQVQSDYRRVIADLSHGSDRVVDKMPINFSFVGVMAAAFPDAPILHIKRDPRATCWSIFRQNFGSTGNRYAFDLTETVAMHGLYQDLMAFWRDLLPGRILDVNYEALTAAPEDEARRILTHCGLDWDPGVLAFHKKKRVVRTASSAQVRKAIYTGSSDEWRNYAPFVGDAFAPLGLD